MAGKDQNATDQLGSLNVCTRGGATDDSYNNRFSWRALENTAIKFPIQ
jgi:hypothetical protein